MQTIIILILLVLCVKYGSFYYSEDSRKLREEKRSHKEWDERQAAKEQERREAVEKYRADEATPGFMEQITDALLARLQAQPTPADIVIRVYPCEVGVSRTPWIEMAEQTRTASGKPRETRFFHERFPGRSMLFHHGPALHQLLLETLTARLTTDERLTGRPCTIEEFKEAEPEPGLDMPVSYPKIRLSYQATKGT